MPIKIEWAERLKGLPPYLFVEIDKRKKAKIQDGKDVIDLGIGDPDQPTPDFIIGSLYHAARNPKNHGYPSNTGLSSFREAIAKWYKERFGVVLNPDNEILPLIGSKEGIAHIPLAFINPGDAALVPDPCYPPYKSGTIFAGGTPHLMPLRADNGFLPDFKGIDPQTANKAVLMFLNYPNNPTSAVAGEGFYNSVVEFAAKNNIIVCHDAAYSEIYYSNQKPRSFLQAKGAKEVGVEFHSLSKTYNMTGWRVGFVCGNSQIIAALGKVKANIDSGVFNVLQLAGVTALTSPDKIYDKIRNMYEERRDTLVDGLKAIGWNINKPEATFYVWAAVPNKSTSGEFVALLLDKADIVATPGVGFGENGEGYVRMALTVGSDRLKEAVTRIGKVL
ncbi:MAG: LL-diaminopimelate aminotransferase [Candidatus Omnitrophota bacterium]